MSVTARAGCAAVCVPLGWALTTCTAAVVIARAITSRGKPKRKKLRAGFFMVSCKRALRMAEVLARRRPAAADGPVGLDPGGDSLALLLDLRAARGHHVAAGVFEFEQAGQATAVARLGGLVRALETHGGSACVVAARVCAVQRDQSGLHLAPRGTPAGGRRPSRRLQ